MLLSQNFCINPSKSVSPQYIAEEKQKNTAFPDKSNAEMLMSLHLIHAFSPEKENSSNYRFIYLLHF